MRDIAPQEAIRLRIVGPFRGSCEKQGPLLEFSAAGEGGGQGNLVGIGKIDAEGEATGETGNSKVGILFS